MQTILKKLNLAFLSTIVASAVPCITLADNISVTANGIEYPIGLKNWRVIGSSFRTDNNTQRVILGNNIAIKASKSGQTKPWPKGTILAKLVWKNTQHPIWNAAIVPGEFVHSEIMIKDAVKFKSTGGWGYARWKGNKQLPYGENASFSQECFACHTQAKQNDYVFTIPVKIP